MSNDYLSNGRYHDSMKGWSIVEKVAQFSQAVGRVSGGRGSAILVALIDSKGHLIDTPLGKRSDGLGIISTNPSQSFTHSRHSNGSIFSARHTGHLNNGGWSASRSVSAVARDVPENSGQSGVASRRTSSQVPPALGVLLTTSHVFSTQEDTESSSVCFLDQPMAGMTAQLGRELKPVHVGLCSTFGFVSSVSAATENARREKAAAAARRARLADGREYFLYDTAADNLEVDKVKEIGFTLTYCEVFPTCDQDPKSPSQLNDSRSCGSHGAFTRSPIPCPSGSVLGYGGGALGGEGRESPVSPCESGLSRRHRGKGSESPNPIRVTGSHQSNSFFTDASSRRISSSQDSLLHVQPLPVPLLISKIPMVNVGDVHLMITHVNGGRRSYRVAHVTAVFADYCVYKPIDVDIVLCSGGPVFNSQGDFIGVQHECGGEGICLFMKSIVHHLFEADLLGMCRSPISEQTVREREKNTGLVAPFILNTRFLPPISGLKGITVPKKSDDHTSPCPRDAAASGGATLRGHRSMLSNGLPTLLTSSKRLYPCSPESGVAEDTRCIMKDFRSVAALINRELRGVNHHSSSGAIDSAYKGMQPSDKGPTADRAVNLPVLRGCSPSKHSSPYIPSFEEVFAEFFDGPGSLPHILYSFPHSFQLVKITIGKLAQLENEDGLEHMASVGGVGAILGAIDGYPQEEQIVTGSLALLCRICVYDRNLAMFLSLDGVDTVMEIMKEYVHQETVLQWGVHALLLATDVPCTSAAASVEKLVRGSAPQLLVSALRMHSSAQRLSAIQRSPYNRLIRWICDLIANLLEADRRCTTLFLQEDFLTLLLEMCRDHAGNAFLEEGFAHVFCGFVQCFTEAEVPGMLQTFRVMCTPGIRALPAASSLNNCSALLSHQPGEQEFINCTSSQTHSSGTNDSRRRGTLEPSASLLDSPKTVACDPQRNSFFFLCDAMRRDTGGCLVRAVIGVCEAALDTKSSVTAHRGRGEVVLIRCLETLRLLLIWGLVQFPRRSEASALENPNLPDFSISFGGSRTCGSVSLLSARTFSPLSEDGQRLCTVCEHVLRAYISPSELMEKAEAVLRLLPQDC